MVSKTSMHSSRMRTVRFLTVSQYALCREGVCIPACTGRGVSAQGGCLPRGVSTRGGVCPGGGMTDRQV